MRALSRGDEMSSGHYRTRGESAITGMFFLVIGRNPVVMKLDGVLAVPVFRTRQAALEAEQAFKLPPAQLREITDGNRFYDAYHHDFQIILDPRIVDGQYRYDKIEVEPDPREVQ